MNESDNLIVMLDEKNGNVVSFVYLWILFFEVFFFFFEEINLMRNISDFFWSFF